MTSKRFNFTFSDDAAKKLKKVPAGQRSAYLEGLINKDFEDNDLIKYIEKYKKVGKPIWSDKDHPDLITDIDFAKYKPLNWRMDKK